MGSSSSSFVDLLVGSDGTATTVPVEGETLSPERVTEEGLRILARIIVREVRSMNERDGRSTGVSESVGDQTKDSAKVDPSEGVSSGICSN